MKEEKLNARTKSEEEVVWKTIEKILQAITTDIRKLNIEMVIQKQERAEISKYLGRGCRIERMHIIISEEGDF